MPSNLFVKLQKYKPSAKITPEENFFTEGLAYILNTEQKLAKLLFGRIGFLIDSNTIIRTQQMIPPSSIIDVYIENKKGRALVEVKLAADLNAYEDDLGDTYDQLVKYSRHLTGTDTVVLLAYEKDILRTKKNKYDFNLEFISWEEVHKVFAKHRLKSLVLNQFIEFMETKSMNYFKGLENNFFQSIGQQDEVTLKTETAVRKEFEEMLHGVWDQLKKKEDSWKLHIYSFDSTKGRYYSHFQNPISNNLGLNINVEATVQGVGVLIWMPSWKFRKSEKSTEQGKINSEEIVRLLREKTR